MNLVKFPEKPDDKANAARELFALYKSYLDAGFDKRQAMDIILTMIQASVRPQRPGNP